MNVPHFHEKNMNYFLSLSLLLFRRLRERIIRNSLYRKTITDLIDIERCFLKNDRLSQMLARYYTSFFVIVISADVIACVAVYVVLFLVYVKVSTSPIFASMEA